MKRPGDTLKRLLGMVLALAIVTGAHYAFQFIRSALPQGMLAAYCTLFALLALGSHYILRRAAERSYRQHQQLTDFTLFLLATNWGLLFAFPSLYGPYNWAWSLTNEVTVPDFVRTASVVLIIAGLVGIVGSMVSLGIPSSSGQKSGSLKTDGPYRLSRNPQLVSGGILVLGYVMLRPTWYAAGWMVLFCFLAHQMILAEEEHLRKTCAPAYENYCSRTARYFTLP